MLLNEFEWQHIYDKLNERKTNIISGDFNIDLLNVSKHNLTSKFLYALYRRGLFSLITKPSRITLNGATLIDNIFVNDLQNSVRSGLLINDHLPVFAVYDSKTKVMEEDMWTRYVRVRTTNAINAFWDDLFREERRGVYVDQCSSTLVLGTHCPACFRYFPPPPHLIQMNGSLSGHCRA